MLPQHSFKDILAGVFRFTMACDNWDVVFVIASHPSVGPVEWQFWRLGMFIEPEKGWRPVSLLLLVLLLLLFLLLLLL